MLKLHETAQMFVIVDYVRKKTVKKSCKYGEYGSFEYLLFLFCLGEYGPRYKPLYFLEKSYWFPKQSGQDDRTGLLNGIEHRDGADVPLEGANIEPVSADMRSKCTMR